MPGGWLVHLTAGSIPSQSSRLEARLLHVLWAERDRLVTRDELISAGWPDDTKDISHDGALNAQMSRLRNKLEPDPENPRYLITEPGVGYRLAVLRSPSS